MNFKMVDSDNNTKLELSGRLDMESSPVLEARLLPALDNTKHITLDFNGIDYVSSAGLRVLLAGDKKTKANGGKMVLVNVSSDVMEVMELTGFNNVLSFE